MAYLRNQISRHGLAAELAAMLVAAGLLTWLMADAIYSGSNYTRLVIDVVAAVVFASIVTGIALAAGEPKPSIPTAPAREVI